jgi:hypothetical protein
VSTRLKDRQEKICRVLAALVEESAKGTPVVGEGKKDAAALQELGVTGPILTLKTGGKNFPGAGRNPSHRRRPSHFAAGF